MTEDTAVGFLKSFVTKPHTTGAVVPSSERLCERMVEGIAWNRVDVVVEFGPGYGPVTEKILRRKRPNTDFFAIEINPDFARSFTRKFPSVTLYEESVENIQSICRRHGIERIDAIISGLPWANFSEQQQDSLLEAMLGVMSPSAEFVTFAYLHGLMLPTGRRFRAKLDGLFGSVIRSESIWRNTPPACFYHCRR